MSKGGNKLIPRTSKTVWLISEDGIVQWMSGRWLNDNVEDKAKWSEVEIEVCEDFTGRDDDNDDDDGDGFLETKKNIFEHGTLHKPTV